MATGAFWRFAMKVRELMKELERATPDQKVVICDIRNDNFRFCPERAFIAQCFRLDATPLADAPEPAEFVFWIQ